MSEEKIFKFLPGVDKFRSCDFVIFISKRQPSWLAHLHITEKAMLQGTVLALRL